MLLVYPLLSSPNVDKRLLPAVAKVLEQYFISNNLDRITTFLGVTSIPSAPASFLRAGKEEPEDKELVVEAALTRIVPMTIPPGIAVEPTFVQVNTPVGALMIGVKVVPLILTDPDAVVKWTLLSAEKLRSLTARLGKFVMRWIMKLLFRNPISNFIRRIVSGAHPKGDLKKDVMYGLSRYGDRMSLVVSNEEVAERPELVDPSNVFHLSKVGWASIVVVDQVNKYIMVCIPRMQSWFRIPFTYVFSTLKQPTAYEDIQDLRKGSSIFKVTPMNLRSGAAKIMAGAKVAKFK